MSLEQLKDEAAHLPPGEQRALIAFLVSQQTANDEAFQSTLARKIDETNPSQWVELDELRQRYSE
jgi:hypothetical protein